MVDTPSGSRPVSPSASRSARVNAVPRFSSDDTSTDEPRSRTRATTPSAVETRSYGRSAITSPTQLRPATGCRKEPTVAWPSRAIGRGLEVRGSRAGLPRRLLASEGGPGLAQLGLQRGHGQDGVRLDGGLADPGRPG